MLVSKRARETHLCPRSDTNLRKPTLGTPCPHRACDGGVHVLGASGNRSSEARWGVKGICQALFTEESLLPPRSLCTQHTFRRVTAPPHPDPGPRRTLSPAGLCSCPPHWPPSSALIPIMALRVTLTPCSGPHPSEDTRHTAPRGLCQPVPLPPASCRLPCGRALLSFVSFLLSIASCMFSPSLHTSPFPHALFWARATF